MQFEHDPQTGSGASLWTAIFLHKVDVEAGIYSGGFRDQTPECQALKNVGATQIPSHAIACTAEDDDLEKINEKFYFKRFLKIWFNCTAEMHRYAFRYLSQPRESENLSSRRSEEQAVLQRWGWLASVFDWSDPYQSLEEVQAYVKDNYIYDQNLIFSNPPASGPFDGKPILKDLREKMRDSCFMLRQAIFREPNDCTVSLTSALGGMSGFYSTIIPNVLHGYAARYQRVQDTIIGLLQEKTGEHFSPTGFPRAYP